MIDLNDRNKVLRPCEGIEPGHGSTRSSDSGIPVETFGSNTVKKSDLVKFVVCTLENQGKHD